MTQGRSSNPTTTAPLSYGRHTTHPSTHTHWLGWKVWVVASHHESPSGPLLPLLRVVELCGPPDSMGGAQVSSPSSGCVWFMLCLIPVTATLCVCGCSLSVDDFGSLHLWVRLILALPDSVHVAVTLVAAVDYVWLWYPLKVAEVVQRPIFLVVFG